MISNLQPNCENAPSSVVAMLSASILSFYSMAVPLRTTSSLAHTRRIGWISGSKHLLAFSKDKGAFSGWQLSLSFSAGLLCPNCAIQNTYFPV